MLRGSVQRRLGEPRLTRAGLPAACAGRASPNRYYFTYVNFPYNSLKVFMFPMGRTPVIAKVRVTVGDALCA